MKLLCCFLVLCFALNIKIYSQQYNFTNYTINDGLPQSVVNCLFQDSQGFIWVGTQNGLSRFDGENFINYRFNPSDPNSISNNWVYAISEDSDGNLWIGTKGGLDKFLRKENHFLRLYYDTGFSHDVTLHSYNNICRENGDILVHTPPVLSSFNLEKQEFVHYFSNMDYDAAVKDVKLPILEDKNGRIWLGCTKGLRIFSFENKEFVQPSFVSVQGDSLLEVNVTAIYQDNEENVWVGTTNGLFLYNQERNSFEEIEFLLQSGEYFSFDICIRGIIKDKSGKLFIGTEGRGLFIISGNPGEKYVIRDYTSENSSISHDIVQTLYIDKSENLWIGTISGISKVDLKRNKFDLYRKDNSPNSVNLLGNVIAGMYKDENGLFWVGNWGQGLNLVNPVTKEVEHFSSQQTGNNFIPNDFVHVIFKDASDNVLLGTRNGIYVYQKEKRRFEEWTRFFNDPNLPVFENTRIYQIIQDRLGNYWIGTSNGLYKVNLEKSVVDIFQQHLNDDRKVSANLVYSLLEDSDGLIWIATISGLDVYNPLTNNITHHYKTEGGLTSNFVITLCEDSLKRIWIGTNAAINIFDKQALEFTYFGEENGLPSNYIYEIVEDKNNDLWLATGNGLCRYGISTNRLQVYTSDNGLQSSEFNLRAAYASTDGQLMFGGMNGFNTFYPDSIESNPYIPNLVVTSFKTTTNESTQELNLAYTNKVVLRHNIQSFSIEFAALEFTNPEENNFAYKMEGVSDEWIQIGNRKFVPFYALPPGRYKFYVKASNNDGLWNNKGVSLDIIVLPPWRRSIYAYISYVVLLGLGILAYVKLRERRLRLDKLRLEKMVLERTIQIKNQNKVITAKNEELNDLNKAKDKFFSIIGHDLLNQFNIIIGFSEGLLHNSKKMDNKKREHYISNIYKSSMLAQDLLGNLLTWARLQQNAIVFKPERIEAAAKIRDLIRFHEEVALKKNILIEVFTKEEINIKADVNMFATIVRNLLANALKFTQPDGEVSIHLIRTNGVCKIKVRDNGVGIPAENLDKIFNLDGNVSTRGTEGQKGTGLGLVLCKEFVEKHGGQIWVESKINAGSNFYFTLPLVEQKT